jgi:hypothetical protein
MHRSLEPFKSKTKELPLWASLGFQSWSGAGGGTKCNDGGGIDDHTTFAGAWSGGDGGTNCSAYRGKGGKKEKKKVMSVEVPKPQFRDLETLTDRRIDKRINIVDMLSGVKAC